MQNESLLLANKLQQQIEQLKAKQARVPRDPVLNKKLVHQRDLAYAKAHDYDREIERDYNLQHKAIKEQLNSIEQKLQPLCNALNAVLTSAT